MVIRKCAEDDKNALRWCVEGKSKEKPVIICSLVIQRILWDICSWKKDGNYLNYGRHFPKNEIVEFCLQNAEEIPDDLFNDPM